MLRSLMTAVTGVRAHQTMLDVTGNNISNVNTVGFKKDATIFADLMYQASKYASGSSENRGGINPAQVGLGVSVAAIETVHTQGSASFTGNESDMMVQGSGYFVYRSNGGTYYSRSGATVRDEDKKLVQAGTGYYLQGYKMTRNALDSTQYDTDSDLSDIIIPINEKLEPRATTEVKYQCNLDSRSDAYLSYGFADMPFNTNVGWTGNPSGSFQTNIANFDCDITVKSLADLRNSTQLPNADNDGDNYLEFTISDGINTNHILFDMTGINPSSGLPRLSLNYENSAAASVPPTTGTAIVGLGPNPPTTFNPNYDDDTGILKLMNDSGEVVFEYDIKSRMNYNSFSITDKSANPPQSYQMIAEFDESVVNVDFNGGANSDLAQTHSTIYLWYSDATLENGVGRLEAEVYFNADGTFASVSPVTSTSGNWPGNFDNATRPGVLSIVPTGDDGQAGHYRYLTIQEDVDPATPSGQMETISQIGIGGYHQVKKTIYDDNGKEHTLEVNFKKLTENRWRWEAFILDEDGNQTDIIPDPHVGEIEFSGAGIISNAIAVNSNSALRHGDNDNSNARVEINVPFSINGQTNTRPLILNFGGGNGVNPGDALQGVTQFASTTTTKAVYQDGYEMGTFERFSIGQDGTITGTYTNGQNIPMYRVALATFSNEQGLEKVGDTMFQETVNSGYANIDPAGVSGKGLIKSQNLEMSNVDLTEEFTHLILSQRGFQANTRVITTSDQILEEVVNLKR